MVWLLSISCAASCEPLLPFLDRLFADHRISIARKLSQDEPSASLLSRLSPEDSASRERILEVLFLHRLLTTSAPIDGARGGILESVYFWHWVKPNPRHRIRMLPDSGLLVEAKPHPAHPSYRSWADMDRTPDLFLADLVADTPRYFHPDFGTFYTFGWCSEREMAFTLLLTRMGYTAKIKFKGNHVWTEVLIEGARLDGSTKNGILRIDNTFDQVGLGGLDKPRSAWLADVGPGNDVVRMNANAKSPEQIRRVENLDLNHPAMDRMEERVSRWLRR